MPPHTVVKSHMVKPGVRSVCVCIEEVARATFFFLTTGFDVELIAGTRAREPRDDVLITFFKSQHFF